MKQSNSDGCRAKLDIYDRPVLRKYLTFKSGKCFHKENFIVAV